MQSKNIVIAVLLLVIITVVGYVFLQSKETLVVNNNPEPEVEVVPVTPADPVSPDVEVTTEPVRESKSVIGNSAAGNEIIAYHFGKGEKEILLIGGIHGGYSWNTSLLAFELIDYYEVNEDKLPEDISLTIIPVANPDGLDSTLGTTGLFKSETGLKATTAERVAGRFNANTVDLNRNFDCEWAATGTWQNQEVSGGTEAFSEPEAQAIKNYVEKYTPAAAIVWFSAEGKVYPSACEDSVSQASLDLATSFAEQSDYPTETEFAAYTITGDMVNWLAKENIPAISVLLSDHRNTELSRNLAGVEAVINTFTE